MAMGSKFVLPFYPYVVNTNCPFGQYLPSKKLSLLVLPLNISSRLLNAHRLLVISSECEFLLIWLMATLTYCHPEPEMVSMIHPH